MANSADPDQSTDLDLHCLQKQSISGFSRTWVKNKNGKELRCPVLKVNMYFHVVGYMH